MISLQELAPWWNPSALWVSACNKTDIAHVNVGPDFSLSSVPCPPPTELIRSVGALRAESPGGRSLILTGAKLGSYADYGEGAGTRLQERTVPVLEGSTASLEPAS